MQHPNDEKVADLERNQDDSIQSEALPKVRPSIETIVDEIKIDCRILPQEYIEEVDIPGGGE
jgi:hypothetical protein